MTTPQPSNQLPEEVKPSAITPSSFIVYPLWLWHDETGEALPRGWTRRHHGTFSGTGLLNMGFTHWHPDQPTAPTGTPYLAPRPPAPVDAETVLKGETFSDSSQGNAMRKKFEGDAEWAKQRIKELELCLHGLLGLEGKDTSAPKLKCYFDSARQLLSTYGK